MLNLDISDLRCATLALDVVVLDFAASAVENANRAQRPFGVLDGGVPLDTYARSEVDRARRRATFHHESLALRRAIEVVREVSYEIIESRSVKQKVAESCYAGAYWLIVYFKVWQEIHVGKWVEPDAEGFAPRCTLDDCDLVREKFAEAEVVDGQNLAGYSCEHVISFFGEVLAGAGLVRTVAISGEIVERCMLDRWRTRSHAEVPASGTHVAPLWGQFFGRIWRITQTAAVSVVLTANSHLRTDQVLVSWWR